VGGHGYERSIPHLMCETRVQRAADGLLDEDKLWGRLCDGDDYCSSWFNAFAQCLRHIVHPISDEYRIKVGTEFALLCQVCRVALNHLKHSL
jgi:hypothetical protein